MRFAVLILAVLAAPGLAGCVTYVRPETRVAAQRPTRPTPPPMPAPTPREPRDEALFDGRTGRETTLDAFVARARRADVVAFGELHDNRIGARYQLALLEALGAADRPVALAMEFFEADQQADLDAYLAGSIDEETFLERTRRSRAYPETHGPLVDWCKANGAPVIAANAPRRLVSGYRKFDGLYGAYKDTLTEEERGWLPRITSTPEDAYWERFNEVMGGGPRVPSFFRAQALWDDAMAESVAAFRNENPDHVVLLIVGGFHVESGLGTITKYRDRRPQDRIVIFQMEMDEDDTLPFRAEDRGRGDVVLKVQRPKRRERPTGPNPHAQPSAEKPPEVQP